MISQNWNKNEKFSEFLGIFFLIFFFFRKNIFFFRKNIFFLEKIFFFFEKKKIIKKQIVPKK